MLLREFWSRSAGKSLGRPENLFMASNVVSNLAGDRDRRSSRTMTVVGDLNPGTGLYRISYVNPASVETRGGR